MHDRECFSCLWHLPLQLRSNLLGGHQVACTGTPCVWVAAELAAHRASLQAHTTHHPMAPLPCSVGAATHQSSFRVLLDMMFADQEAQEAGTLTDSWHKLNLQPQKDSRPQSCTVCLVHTSWSRAAQPAALTCSKTTILTPGPSTAEKESTEWMRPACSGIGVGSASLAAAYATWVMPLRTSLSTPRNTGAAAAALPVEAASAWLRRGAAWAAWAATPASCRALVSMLL